MSFLQELSAKVTLVRNWYWKVYEGYSMSAMHSPSLTPSQLQMFDSATRWHSNSHYSEDDWIRNFNSISNELNVCDKMEIEPELCNFVKEKKLKENLQDRFSYPDLLDCLEPAIKKLYCIRLHEEEDEFECSFGANFDQQFFLNYFTPTAMLKTYMAVHKSASVNECLPELFSIGGGSATLDLFPEVTGVCGLCAGNSFGNLKSDDDISNSNKLVILKQFENKFMDPKHFKFDSSGIFSDNISSKSCRSGPSSCKNSVDLVKRNVRLDDSLVRRMMVDHAKVSLEIMELTDTMELAVRKELFKDAEDIKNKVNELKIKKNQLDLDIKSGKVRDTSEVESDTYYSNTVASKDVPEHNFGYERPELESTNKDATTENVEITKPDLDGINENFSFNKSVSEQISGDLKELDENMTSSDESFFNPFASGDKEDFQICNPFVKTDSEHLIVKPFKCDICSKQFSESEFVVMHMKNFHTSRNKKERNLMTRLSLTGGGG